MLYPECLISLLCYFNRMHYEAQADPKCLLFFVLPQSEDAPLVQDVEDDLFGIGQSSQDFLEVRKAEYVGYRKLTQKERDGQLFFTPSFQTGILSHTESSQLYLCVEESNCLLIMVTVPTSNKLPENKKPRYLEDEGLYVGVRPPVSLTNENILENRLLKMEEVISANREDHVTVSLFVKFPGSL